MGQKQTKPNIPGVIMSEDWSPPAAEDFSAWKGALFHVRSEQLPAMVKRTVEQDDPARKPGPEEVPYTFWERIGAVPLSAARLRPRQYYHPVTDFSKYPYDAMSPEEVELRSRWMARMWEFGWQYPLVLWSVGSAMCIPLPFRVRLPATVAVGISVCMMEFQRVYVAAAKEKEQLDDFLFAKEIWFIKNVETREFGLETLPPGVTGVQAVQDRWQEEEALSRLDESTVRHGMQAPIASPAYRGPGLEDATGRQTATGGVYIGDIGVARPGQVQQQRGLMRLNEDKRVPNLSI